MALYVMTSGDIVMDLLSAGSLVSMRQVCPLKYIVGILLIMNHCFPDIEPLGNAYFGEGTGSIYFGNLNCNGSEERIVDCSSISPHSCHHSEDAGVRCGGEYIIYMYVNTCSMELPV